MKEEGNIGNNINFHFCTSAIMKKSTFVGDVTNMESTILNII
jgi:hypothetical protein